MKAARLSLCALVALAGVFLAAVPASADYKLAVSYYKQGRFDKAIQELKPDLDQNPDWEFGHRLMGLCYLNLKNNALAIASLSRAVQLQSAAFPAYQGLGQAYYNLQRFDNSVQILNQGESLAKEPDERYNLHHLRGSAYYRLEKFREAADDLAAAIRLRTTDWTNYSQLGIAYYNLGRHEDAQQALLKALALRPGHNVTTEYMGKTYFKRGVASLSDRQYTQAIEHFRKARDYTPNDGFVFYNIAEAYLFQQNYTEAEKSLNQALSLMPRSAEVFQRLGLVYEKQKKWDQAMEAYRKAFELNPSPGLQEALNRIAELKKR